MFMERQQRVEKSIMSTEIGSNLQSVVHLRVSDCMKECGGLVQPTWTICSVDIVRFVASAELRRRQKPERDTITEHVFKALFCGSGSVDEREATGSTLCTAFPKRSFTCVESGFVEGGSTPYLNAYVEERNFIRHRLEV